MTQLGGTFTTAKATIATPCRFNGARRFGTGTIAVLRSKRWAVVASAGRSSSCPCDINSARVLLQRGTRGTHVSEAAALSANGSTAHTGVASTEFYFIFAAARGSSVFIAIYDIAMVPKRQSELVPPLVTQLLLLVF